MFGRLNLDITHMGTGEVSSILSMILIKLKKRAEKAPFPILKLKKDPKKPLFPFYLVFIGIKYVW